MSLNSSPQLRWDQLRLSAVLNVVSSDEFFVDKFFDFSDQYAFEDPQNGDYDKDKQQKGYTLLSVSPQETEDCEIPKESFYVTEEFGLLSTTDLTIPIDDLANLEWMSNFIDDSFSEQFATFPAEIWTEKTMPNQLEKETKTAIALTPQLSFKNAVHVKVRSKRIRIGGRVWGDGGVVPFPKKIVCRNTKASSAKLKIKSSVNEYGKSGTTQTKWRCSHCAVQETPLVRAGLGGSKTLCNACGIRYKSGRLLPEYRPVSCPTFTTELYSNHHLKVLEMWQKKTNPELPEHGFTPLVVDSVL